MRKKQCLSCNNKEYYTQIFGYSYSDDWCGGERIVVKPTIHRIACPHCNWKNKKKLKGVQKDHYNSLG